MVMQRGGLIWLKNGGRFYLRHPFEPRYAPPRGLFLHSVTCCQSGGHWPLPSISTDNTCVELLFLLYPKKHVANKVMKKCYICKCNSALNAKSKIWLAVKTFLVRSVWIGCEYRLHMYKPMVEFCHQCIRLYSECVERAVSLFAQCLWWNETSDFNFTETISRTTRTYLFRRGKRGQGLTGWLWQLLGNAVTTVCHTVAKGIFFHQWLFKGSYSDEIMFMKAKSFNATYWVPRHSSVRVQYIARYRTTHK